MTTPIGTAVLQIIPSLDGVSEAVNKQLGGTLLAAGKKGGKDLAKGVGDGLKDLEREVDSAAKAYDKLKDKADDALGKVRKDEAALQDLRDKGITSGARFVAAEERLATSRRNSSRAAREAEDGNRSLMSAQNALADGSSEVDSRLGGLTASMGNMATMAGGAALAGLGALAAGAVGLGKALFEVGAEFDDMSDTIAVKTGATGAELTGLEDVAKNLGKTIPESFSDLGETVAEANRNLHLTGPELEQVSETLANLGRITGEQVDMRGLGKAFRAFGVDAAGQVPALNSLYEASTDSGLSVNDLIGTVAKSGATLKQFGLGFGESAALVTTFEEAGVDGEKSMAALTKAFANFSKDGVPAQQGLRDTIGEIQRLISVGDEAGAGGLANKVFGAKAGVNFFEAIKSGALDVASLNNAISSTGVSINEMAYGTDDAAEKWQLLKNRAMEALEPLGTGIFNMLGGDMDKLADYVGKNQGQIIGGFTSIASTALMTGGAIGKFVAGSLSVLGTWTTAVGTAFGGAIKVMGDAAKEIGFLIAKVPGMESVGASIAAAGIKASATGSVIANTGQQFSSAANAIDATSNVMLDASDKVTQFGNNAQASAGRAQELANILGAMPGAKQIDITAIVTYKDTGGIIIPPDQLKAPVRAPAVPGETVRRPGRAGGGPITGPGGPKSDIIPIWASNGEHMLSAADVSAMGGQGGVYAFRQALHRAEGGAITVDELKQFAAGISGHGYVWGGGNGTGWDTDCSGAQSTVANYITGGKGRFATATEATALASRGFQDGDPPAGVAAYWVGWKNGGPGGGHTAGTIIDPVGGNVNVEMGGAGGNGQFGGEAAGASSFPNRAWIALGAGDDPTSDNFSGGDSSPFAGGSAAAAMTGGGAAAPSTGSGGGSSSSSASSSGAGSSFKLPSAFSGLASIGLDGMGITTKVSPDTPERTLELGNAASAAVGGQIDSALGVFGVNGSPGWLKAASELVSGISIGGGDGASAAPLSALPGAAGAAIPDDAGNMHGARAGQAPGPTYNITARDTEDAFIKAQRLEREKAAAKLSRY